MLGETRHRRAVSDACLVIECNYACAAHHLVGEKRRFIGGCRSCEKTRRGPAIDRSARRVLRDEVGVAIVFQMPCNAVERIFPGNLLELGRTRLAYLWILQAGLRLDEVLQCRTLRAKRAAIGRVIRIAFDMDQLGLLAFLTSPWNKG